MRAHARTLEGLASATATDNRQRLSTHVAKKWTYPHRITAAYRGQAGSRRELMTRFWM
jgi:hypothetical protein